LAAVVGMNTFAAAIMLARTSLAEFLAMGQDQRLQEFGPLVGVERIVELFLTTTSR
jgi:hypothetical protein